MVIKMTAQNNGQQDFPAVHCFYIYQYLFYLIAVMILAISTVTILSVIPPDIT